MERLPWIACRARCQVSSQGCFKAEEGLGEGGGEEELMWQRVRGMPGEKDSVPQRWLCGWRKHIKE